jgi:CIC family chloride channel protein
MRNGAPGGVNAGLVRLAVVAAASGAVTGVVGSAFRVTLVEADALRDALIAWARQWPAFGWLLPVSVAAFLVALAHWMVQRIAPLAAGSGVQHVEAVMRGEAQPAPFAVLPVKFIGGFMAIGSGLALGREGPTVQMGATIGAQMAERLHLDEAGMQTMQGAAAGAGLAVAFNAPIGGVAFIFEELARRFTVEMMVAAMAACSTAVLVMRALLGNEVDFHVSELMAPSLATVLTSLLLGALLGALGAAYSRAIVISLNRFAAWTRVPGTVHAAVIGGVVGLVAWFEPRVVGGGDPIVQGVLDGRLSLSLLAIAFAARWLLGPFSYSAGTPGGLFAPLLVVGAVCGAIFATVADRFLPALHLDATTLAIVGMAAFFAAVVRAPLTGTLLVLGMTGTIVPLIPVLGACLTATIVPFLLGSAPIYDTLRERMLGKG